MEFFIRDESAVEALATSLNIGSSTAAAVLLMDHAAPGWEANVNAICLDMFSVNCCILGYQINKHPFFEGCEGFSGALWRLGDVVNSRSAIDDGSQYNFSHSTEDWVRVLSARRDAPVTPESGSPTTPFA